MTVEEFIQEVNDNLRGVDDEAPVASSDEWNFWLRTTNKLRRTLARDVSKRWRFTYKETSPNEPGTVATVATTALTGTSTKFNDYRVGDKITVSGETERTIATIVSDTSLTVTVAFSNTASGKTLTHKTIIASGVEAYNLHRRFLAPSATCYTINSDNKRTYFDIIHPEERNDLTQQVYMSDENPEILNFTQEIESTYDYVGDTLQLPGYYLPVDLATEEDVIDVPDYDWLVMATAAKVAFSDLTYEDKVADLNAEANALYKQMVTNNRRGTYNDPRVTPTNVKRISGTRRSG